MQAVLKLHGREAIRTLNDLTDVQVKERIKNWKKVYGNTATFEVRAPAVK